MRTISVISEMTSASDRPPRAISYSTARLHLHQLLVNGFMHQDGIGGHERCQFLRQLMALTAHPKHGLKAIAEQGHHGTIHVEHLHHAAAGGDGAHEVTLLPVAQREAVGVRVRIPGVHGLDADAHA